MIKLNAAQRLLGAESEWWTSLSDTMKEQYVKEHPESKYAKEWHKGASERAEDKPAERSEPEAQKQKSDPQKKRERDQEGEKRRAQEEREREHQERREPKAEPEPKSDGESETETEGDEPEQKKQTPVKTVQKPKAKPKKFNPKDPKYAKAMAAGGSSRKRAVAFVAEGLNEDMKGFANMAIKDMGAAVKSTVTVGKLLMGKQGELDSQDAKNIARTLFNFCGIVALGGAFALGGPAAALLFVAAKYSTYAMAKSVDDYLSTPKYDPKAERGTPQNPDYGYWGESGKWNQLSKEEWETLSDEEIERMAQHSSLVAASNPQVEEQESVEAVLRFVLKFANSGRIPDQAWRRAEQELNKQQVH